MRFSEFLDTNNNHQKKEDGYLIKQDQVVQAKLQAILRRTYSFSKDFHLLTYQDVH